MGKWHQSRLGNRTKETIIYHLLRMRQMKNKLNLESSLLELFSNKVFHLTVKC